MEKPLFTVMCAEPEGEIERSVYELVFTPQNLQKFWDAAKQFSTLYGREINSIKEFMDFFITYDRDGNETLEGLFFCIPDDKSDNFLGVFYITNITGTEADVHYSFFDKRHRGRVPLVKKMIKYVFETYGFRRLNASIPLYASPFTRHFVTNVGFKVEGKKHSAAKYKGIWYDVMLYGMLYSDILPSSLPSTEPSSEDKEEIKNEEA